MTTTDFKNLKAVLQLIVFYFRHICLRSENTVTQVINDCVVGSNPVLATFSFEKTPLNSTLIILMGLNKPYDVLKKSCNATVGVCVKAESTMIK